MAQKEQALINEFHEKFNRGLDLSDLIARIRRECPRSVVLTYYTGMYYARQQGRWDLAEAKFLDCTQMERSFAPPYFELAQHYITEGNHRNAERLLMRIFDTKTIDASTGRPSYVLSDQIRVSSLLGPLLRARKDVKGFENVYSTLYHRLVALRPAEVAYVHLEGFKNICLGLGGALTDDDPDRAYDYYRHGLVGIGKRTLTESLGDAYREMLFNLDKSLLQGCMLSGSYAVNAKPLSPGVFEKLYPDAYAPPVMPPLDGKIRVGYMSPDFNKNAVGLFVTPLLKHFDASKFEVYVYYTNTRSDEFTEVFRSYPNVHWTDVGDMYDTSIVNLMRNRHKLHVLFDLIVHGTNDKLGVVAMRPAPVVINYLGFPASSFMKQFTHRITDAICDPVGTAHCTEQLIRLPRTFSCFKLFENIPDVPIEYNPHLSDEVWVSIVNRKTKHHAAIREAWKSIMEKDERFVLWLKLSKGEEFSREHFAGFPLNRIRIMPFYEALPDYLNAFNDMDFCLDTYPYSGTTTTCTALYMGVPTVTFHTEKDLHVSRVTTSLMVNVGEPEFACASSAEYVQKVLELATAERLKELRDPDARRARRARFLELMNPDAYMRGLEAAVLDTLKPSLEVLD